MTSLIVSPLLPSPSIPMRGTRSNEQFRLLSERGHRVRAVVPVPWRPPAGRAAWRDLRRIPLLEQDHGVDIAHPRYLSLGAVGRIPGTARLARSLFRRAVLGEVQQYVRGGGRIVQAYSCALPGALTGDVGPARMVVSMWDDELFDVAPARDDWREAIRDTLRSASHVVYVTPTLRKLGEELAGPHRASVIPLAIDEYPDITAEPAPHFTVVTAARLIRRKRIDAVLEAFAAFRSTVDAARLVILGDGPELAPLIRQAETLNVTGDVSFPGMVSHREVIEALARAHVFALPSERESFGTVYFEAMAQRVPVIGSRGEGIADHVTDGVDGFLVQPGDVAGMVRLFQQLHAAPERARTVADRGYALFARSGVRWPQYVDAYLSLYDELLSDR